MESNQIRNLHQKLFEQEGIRAILLGSWMKMTMEALRRTGVTAIPWTKTLVDPVALNYVANWKLGSGLWLLEHCQK